MLVLFTKIAVYLSLFILFVISEITEILDIEVFVTKQERLKRDSAQNQIKKNESELKKFIAASAVQSDKLDTI